MSGLAGLVLLEGAEVTPSALNRLAAAYPHPVYGDPDLWRNGPAGMVRFPLRNTPQSQGEVQPFFHEGSGAALLFDGRLDNREDLLRQLGGDAPPHQAPDGRIVLAAFERFGDQAIHRLVGDYALALWRPRERRLYCARSPVGWRPFLWTFDGRRLAFANEPRTLVEGLPLERRLNEGAIAEQLAGRFTSLTDTFWDGIHRLPPGEALVLENGRVRTLRWNEGPFEDFSDLSDDDHVERFRAVFDEALIAAHRSEGAVASQLSGGLDSSSVVCRSVDLHRAGRISGQVQPISARFPGQTCDEGPWIEAVERQIGFQGAAVSPILFNVDDAESWCARTLHLPMRPNALATLAPVCDLLISRDINVLLTGEGGDDWLNGSRSHWPDLFLKGHWGALLGEGMDQGGGTVPGKLMSLLRGSVGPVVSARRRDNLFRPHTQFSTDAPAWIRPELAQRVSLAERWRQAPGPPDLDSYAQRQRYIVYALSMRHMNSDMVASYAAGRGIEMRHPFHDLRLTRFAMGAAGGMLRRGGQRKHILREAMRGVLPEEVRTRQSKSNFSASMINAVADHFKQKRPQDLLPVQMGWIDVAPLLRIHEEYVTWAEAGALPPFPSQPYGPVWNAVSVDIWLEKAFKP